LVKELLDQESKAVGASLADALRTRWQNIVVNPTRDDAAVLNAAVLIDRAEAAEFDQVLERLDRSYDARLKFRRVGPLPPYSFATAEVKTIPAARLDGARKLLGLGESASLAQIKAAYRRLIQEVHPDRNSEARASERLAGISEAHDLLEEYALNFPHTFSADQANPVIVTVRSLDDLRGAAGVSPRRGRAGRPDGAGAQAA
jgi:DnaJ-domain-containing protein 1